MNFEAEFLKNYTVNMLDTEWVNSQDGPEDQVYQTFVRNYGSKGFYSRVNIARIMPFFN